jgi:hypothetical protein
MTRKVSLHPGWSVNEKQQVKKVRLGLFALNSVLVALMVGIPVQRGAGGSELPVGSPIDL